MNDGTKKYYVLFSENKGVFLDNKDWSYNESVCWAHDRVRTFPEKDLREVIDWFQKYFQDNEIRAIEVTPDHKFMLASIEACAAAGLPRWEYDRDRVERELRPRGMAPTQPSPEEDE